MEREEGKPDLVEQIREFGERVRAKGRPELRAPVDKDYIDGLYE